jgi:TPR repeat protein
MNNQLPIQSSKAQPVAIVNWKETQGSNGHNFNCIHGKLIHSTIWIREQDQFDKNRYCSIILRGDDKLIYPRLRYTCDEVKHPMKSPGLSDDSYTFYVRVNGKQSEKFLDCINLINSNTPLGKEAMSAISKLIVGYSLEGNAGVNFLPMFGFILAMNAQDFLPSDVTKLICQLFIRSTGIEFAEKNTEQFYKEFAVKALKGVDNTSQINQGKKYVRTAQDLRELIGKNYPCSDETLHDDIINAIKNNLFDPNHEIVLENMSFDLGRDKTLKAQKNITFGENCWVKNGRIEFHQGELNATGKNASVVACGEGAIANAYKGASADAKVSGATANANDPDTTANAEATGAVANANAPNSTSNAHKPGSVANANVAKATACTWSKDARGYALADGATAVGMAPHSFVYAAAKGAIADSRGPTTKAIVMVEGGIAIGTEVVSYLQFCADMGDPGAAFKFGLSLVTAFFATEDDMKIGREYLEKAHNLGHKEAAFELGKAYSDYTYIRKDLILAKEWFGIAAQKGNGKAKQWLLENMPKDSLFVTTIDKIKESPFDNDENY